jgi:hypothetical protein
MYSPVEIRMFIMSKKIVHYPEVLISTFVMESVELKILNFSPIFWERKTTKYSFKICYLNNES